MRSVYKAALLLTAAFLAGCSDNNNSAFSFSEAEILTEEATRDNGIYSLRTDCKSASVLRDGSLVCSVEFDAPVKDEKNVLSVDLNADKFEDVFVYYGGFRADCWLYDHESRSFVSAGKGLPVAFADYRIDPSPVTCEADSDNKTVTVMQSCHSRTGSTVYKWQSDRLVPESMSIRYNTIEDGMLVDNYIFDENGSRILDERQHIDYGTGECTASERDIEYFRVTDSSVDYMKGAELLQSIEAAGLPDMCSEILADDSYRDIRTGVDYPLPVPEKKMLSFDDFDFDGHGDLSIHTESVVTGESEKYVYYRYDSESGKYVEWDELDKLGEHCLIAFPDAKEIAYYEEASDTKNNNQYIYVWENGALKLVKRKEYIRGRGIYKLYEYDGSGNESYVKDVVLPTGTY